MVFCVVLIAFLFTSKSVIQCTETSETEDGVGKKPSLFDTLPLNGAFHPFFQNFKTSSSPIKTEFSRLKEEKLRKSSLFDTEINDNPEPKLAKKEKLLAVKEVKENSNFNNFQNSHKQRKTAVFDSEIGGNHEPILAVKEKSASPMRETIRKKKSSDEVEIPISESSSLFDQLPNQGAMEDYDNFDRSSRSYPTPGRSLDLRNFEIIRQEPSRDFSLPFFSKDIIAPIVNSLTGHTNNNVQQTVQTFQQSVPIRKFQQSAPPTTAILGGSIYTNPQLFTNYGKNHYDVAKQKEDSASTVIIYTPPGQEIGGILENERRKNERREYDEISRREKNYEIPKRKGFRDFPRNEYGAPERNEYKAPPRSEYGTPQKNTPKDSYAPPSRSEYSNSYSAPQRTDYNAPEKNEYNQRDSYAPPPRSDYGTPQRTEYGAPQRNEPRAPKYSQPPRSDYGAPQPNNEYSPSKETKDSYAQPPRSDYGAINEYSAKSYGPPEKTGYDKETRKDYGPPPQKDYSPPQRNENKGGYEKGGYEKEGYNNKGYSSPSSTSVPILTPPPQRKNEDFRERTLLTLARNRFRDEESEYEKPSGSYRPASDSYEPPSHDTAPPPSYGPPSTYGPPETTTQPPRDIPQAQHQTVTSIVLETIPIQTTHTKLVTVPKITQTFTTGESGPSESDDSNPPGPPPNNAYGSPPAPPPPPPSPSRSQLNQQQQTHDALLSAYLTATLQQRNRGNLDLLQLDQNLHSRGLTQNSGFEYDDSGISSLLLGTTGKDQLDLNHGLEDYVLPQHQTGILGPTGVRGVIGGNVGLRSSGRFRIPVHTRLQGGTRGAYVSPDTVQTLNDLIREQQLNGAVADLRHRLRDQALLTERDRTRQIHKALFTKGALLLGALTLLPRISSVAPVAAAASPYLIPLTAGRKKRDTSKTSNFEECLKEKVELIQKEFFAWIDCAETLNEIFIKNESKNGSLFDALPFNGAIVPDEIRQDLLKYIPAQELQKNSKCLQEYFCENILQVKKLDDGEKIIKYYKKLAGDFETLNNHWIRESMKAAEENNCKKLSCR